MAVFKISTAKTTSQQALKSVIKYVLNDQKSPDKEINVTGFFSGEVTADAVYDSFMKNKQLWHKETGRMYSHMMIAFHHDEKITPYEVSAVAHEFCEKAYPGHQALIVVHQDRKHLHAHIVMDSVSYEDGHKIQTSKKDLLKQREICDEICRSHGLSVTEKGKNFYGRNRNPGDITSWKKNTYRAIKSEPQSAPQRVDMLKLLIALLDALLYARSLSDFIERLKRAMWKVTWTPERKHVTFESMETGRKFSSSNLNRTFEPKFKYIFGDDFSLDKVHMEELFSMLPADFKQEKAAGVQEELKKEIAAWHPPAQKEIEQLQKKLRKRHIWEHNK